MVEVEKELNDLTTKVGEASKAYKKATDVLRSTMQNDVASIQSSGNKTLFELGKLNNAFAALLKLMDGPDMKSAINNAERLAAALKAISELQNHSITFAVLDKKTA